MRIKLGAQQTMKQTLALLAAALLLTACASTANGQAYMGAADSPAIFSYDGRTYTAADFDARLRRDIGDGVAGLLAQGQTREQIEQLAEEVNVRGQVFDQMVQDALLARYARQHGIGVDPAGVDAAVIAAVMPGDSFQSITGQRVRAAVNQLNFEVIARNTYAPMANLRHILVVNEAAADQVIADLAAGADFAALARERSLDGDSNQSGGALGWVPRGNYPAAFDEVAFSAPLRTPTKATTDLGVHVIEVLDRAESRAFDSFDQLSRAANAQQYYEETFLPWYEELRREAENSGELQFAPNFDPANAPLPFPEGTP